MGTRCGKRLYVICDFYLHHVQQGHTFCPPFVIEAVLAEFLYLKELFVEEKLLVAVTDLLNLAEIGGFLMESVLRLFHMVFATIA